MLLGIEVAHAISKSLQNLRPNYPASQINIHKLTPDGRSWVLHAKHFMPVDDADMQTLWAARPMEVTSGVIMGKTIPFPRRTAAFGVDYKYTGQTQLSHPEEAAPAPIRERVAELRHGVEEFSIHNAMLVNWYEACNGEYMGAHSDDETALRGNEPIVSMSWASRGHYRRFRFTAKKHVADALIPDWGDKPGVMRLYNGCLVVMGGQCQKTHKHELMKPTKALGESEGRRINLTLRAFGEKATQESKKRMRQEGD